MSNAKLDLYRYHTDDEGTISIVYALGAIVCQMTELPWRNNRRGLSCIPAGVYPVDYLERSASGKYLDVYHVREVEGRSGILIHPGNFSGDRTKGLRTHSWGCILPGSRIGRLNGQRALLGSRIGLEKLHAVTGRNKFTLEIHDA